MKKKKIVRRYATVIVEDLRKQIYASKEESTEFVFNVQKDLIVFKSFAKNMKENGRLNFKKEVPDKKNIKQYLFEGYKNHIMQRMHLIVMMREGCPWY